MPQSNTCVQTTDAQGHNTLPPTIYTQNLGAQLTYNIDFTYQSETDVVVYRQATATDEPVLLSNANSGGAQTNPNYTINTGVSPSQVTFTAAPGGVRLIIGRRTNICTMLAVYQVGAAIRAGDLNMDNTQLLNLIQELRSTIGQIVNGNTTDPIIPGDGIDLDDLDDVVLANPTPNPSLLRWNGTNWVNNDVIETGDAWPVNSNTSFATTAAGDARWLGGGAAPDVVGGPGITITPNQPQAGQILVSADLEAAGAGTGGLAFDPAAGNNGEIRVDVGNGLELTNDGVEVDLAAATPGLQFTGGDLQVIGNSIEEAVPGQATNPILRNGPTDVTITGGANVTVTRDSATQFTIAASASGLTYRDQVNPTTTGVTSALPDADVNDIYAVNQTGTLEAAPINWVSVITGATNATVAVAGDILLCTTAADGTPANARYTLVRTGTFNNLQAVTTGAGNNQTSNGLIVRNAANTGNVTSLLNTGAASFTLSQTDFTVASNSNNSMFVVDGSADRVGVGVAAPVSTLDVNGEIRSSQIGADFVITGSNAAAQPLARTISLSAPEINTFANSYSLTLPPTLPATPGLALVSTTNGTMSWAVAGGASGGTGQIGGVQQQDQIFWENQQVVRFDYPIPANTNAGSFGPITVNNGVTVTIPATSSWTII